MPDCRSHRQSRNSLATGLFYNHQHLRFLPECAWAFQLEVRDIGPFLIIFVISKYAMLTKIYIALI